jgi:hypothetical protein
MEKAYNVSNIYFEEENLVVVINDQKYLFYLADISDKLARASDTERNNFNISPSGYGIHWPSINEDLSINGLLKQLKKRHVA